MEIRLHYDRVEVLLRSHYDPPILLRLAYDSITTIAGLHYGIEDPSATFLRSYADFNTSALR